MHTFWEIVASNALLVTALALGVALLGRVWKNPAGLHLLWMLVLVKLFTPPIITIGVPLPVDLAAPAPKSPRADNEEAYPPVVEPPGEQLAAAPSGAPPVRLPESAAIPRRTDPAVGAPAAAGQQRTLPWPTILAWTWGIGIVVFAFGHACRVLRFQKLLRDTQAPPAAVCRMAERIGRRLGLKRIPEILMLPVRLSPLVWCAGGRPRVILPAELFERLDPDAREAILVHELAHVRRRDHLVRLLETFATTLFWWHPVVWWACGRLRELEEQCCDAAVLEAVPHGARTYATALVDTLDFLSERSAAVPLAATAARSTVSIARRIEMLCQRRANRLTAGSVLVVILIAVVPMALAFAAEGQEQAAKPAVATAVLTLPSEIGVEPADRLPEGSAVGVTELFRHSHHVGFVIVDPLVSAPQYPWKQRAFLYRIDSLKGELPRDPATNELPWVYGGLEGRTRYPTQYPQKAEYLAFLRGREVKGRRVLTTLAAFPVQYRPDETGRVVGKVVAGRNRKETLDVLQARHALETIVKGGTLSAEAREAVDAFFQAAVVPVGASSGPAPVPFEERFREAKQLAASIKIGTTRKDVHKIFPQEDGGISGPGSQRYYLGSEVMVEVPFDQTGGAWKPENRVNGAVKVYRSHMHAD